MEHTELIAITRVDTALTRNLAFTQMGLVQLDVILATLANCAKEVSCICNIPGVKISFRIKYFYNKICFFVPGVKTALRHNCSLKGTRNPLYVLIV